MTENVDTQQNWKPSINPWLTTMALMLTTFVCTLNTSIANVALPKIAGCFSATTNESTWVLTSYLVANGIILPTTAWFSTLFGRKKFLLICTFIFCVASFLCGISPNLNILVLARVIQGLGGGAIIPISQATMLESFPKEKHAMVMSIFGLGLIFAPILGPTLGGWITDSYSWHWIFLINVPTTILAFWLCSMFVEDPPWAKKGEIEKIDYWGFLFLVIWLFTLQVVLDNGQRNDWFDAAWIRWFSSVSVISLIAFLIRELTIEFPIIDLKVFKDRNFVVGSILIIFVSAILYSTLAILPLFLQKLMKYTALLSGYAISPRGVGSLIGILMAAYLSTQLKFSLKYLTGFGLLILGLSGFMFGEMTLQISIMNVIIPNIVCGIGLSLVLICLTTISFVTLKNEQMTNASGIGNLIRSVGGAIGISCVSTMITRKAQIHQAYLVHNLSAGNYIFMEKLAGLQAFFGTTGLTPELALKKSGALLYQILVQQANLMAFIDTFRAFGFISIVLIPLIFLFRVPKQSSN